MKITQTRVKQYNSTYKTVIAIDGVPVCITRSNKRASDIVSYLSGYEVEINDGKLNRRSIFSYNRRKDDEYSLRMK